MRFAIREVFVSIENSVYRVAFQFVSAALLTLVGVRVVEYPEVSALILNIVTYNWSYRHAFII